MLTLSQPERAAFKMPAGLGGQSTSIYKRVLKKIYGSEKGVEVANEMFKNPFAVVPIVMARLKQKDEEWRFTQVCANNCLDCESCVDLLDSESGRKFGRAKLRRCT